MSQSSWIKHTKQTWKLFLTLGLAVIAIACLLIAFKYDKPELFLLFMFVAGFALVWLIFSVKCPYCRYRIVKHQFFNEEIKFNWFDDVMLLEKCPSCGRELRGRNHGKP